MITKRELIEGLFEDPDFKEMPMDTPIEIYSNPWTSWELLGIYKSDDGKKLYIEIEEAEKGCEGCKKCDVKVIDSKEEA
jgi:hypothetical protein